MILTFLVKRAIFNNNNNNNNNNKKEFKNGPHLEDEEREDLGIP